jgi:hypothetical protein
MMTGKQFVSVTAMLILACVASGVQAQSSNNRWFLRGDFQGLVSGYSGSQQRDTFQNFGAFIRADYLDRGGVTVGYNRGMLGFQDGIPDIDQDSLFLSGRWHTRPDWAAGQLTFRLDGHVISNTDVTNETDDVTVIAPQLSYLNYAQTFYVDIGYSGSSYGDSILTSETLQIDQWTPTLGFGFNEQRDWLQLRTYLIESSNPQRSQSQEDTAALELKWTHWPMSSGLLGLDNFRVSTLLGERVFAVDPDAGGTYNLADLQTGSASIGGEWVLSEHNRILLLLGFEQYENRAVNEEYRNSFMYLNFTHAWE